MSYVRQIEQVVGSSLCSRRGLCIGEGKEGGIGEMYSFGENWEELNEELREDCPEGGLLLLLDVGEEREDEERD